MQYHALSLCEMNELRKVTAIGYSGEALISELDAERARGKLDEIRLEAININSLRFSSLLHAVVKGLYLLWSLISVLWRIPRFDVVIVQNPPCLPVLGACLFYSYFVNDCVICIDWHNLGFSMYRPLGGASQEDSCWKSSPVVVVSRFMECFLACHVNFHITVSEAMKTWLRTHFRLPRYSAAPVNVIPDAYQEGKEGEEPGDIRVLPDRPAERFTPKITAESKHLLLEKLNYHDASLFPKLLNKIPFEERASPVLGGDRRDAIGEERGDSTCLTTRHGDGSYSVRSDAAAVLISATSWTEDEDFELLYQALQDLDRALGDVPMHGDTASSHAVLTGKRSPRAAPRVLVVITGKGPLKATYAERFAALEHDELTRVAIRMPWLEPEDYPTMMSCADLGLSLHTSTSGLDLPMKVLDMFGAGVPVIAVDFPALPELVLQGVNGFIFKPAEHAQARELPTLRLCMRKLLVQTISHRYGNRVSPTDFLESPSRHRTMRPSPSTSHFEFNVPLPSPTKSPPSSPSRGGTGMSRPPLRNAPPLLLMQTAVREEAMDLTLRWRQQWTHRMRPIVLNMIFQRMRGPPLWFTTLRFVVFTAGWVALVYLGTSSYRLHIAQTVPLPSDEL